MILKVKRKINGFTLIEILAVIVILAIVALMAVPVVTNIIKKSQKSAFKDSIYGIIKAGELYYANRLLESEGMSEDKIFTFPSDTTGLDLKGNQPSSGSLIVTKDGKVAIGVTGGKYCVTKGFEDADVTITEEVNECYNPGVPKTLSQLATTGTFTKADGTDVTTVSEVDECVTDKTAGACEPGTAFAIKVNQNNIYKFYVISDAGNKVTLIMDRNIGGRIAWINKEDYIEAGGNEVDFGTYGNATKGPITALKMLESATSSWTNIKAYDYTLTDDDKNAYSIIRTQVRARLLTKTEASALGCTGSKGSCPSYLYENLSGANTEKMPLAYWTSSTKLSNAWYIKLEGLFSANYAADGTLSLREGFRRGVRPVIELSK